MERFEEVRPTREHAIDRALEPESSGIWKTLVRSPLWLGSDGAVIGLLVFVLMLQIEVRFVVDNATAALLLLLAFCTIGGLLLGNLLTLRRDPSRLRPETFKQGKDSTLAYVRITSLTSRAGDHASSRSGTGRWNRGAAGSSRLFRRTRRTGPVRPA